MTALLRFHLLSGHAWFSAGAVVIVIAALDIAGVFDRSVRQKSAARVALALAIGVALLSGTPVPIAVTIPSGFALAGYLVYGHASPVSRTRRSLAITAMVATTVALGIELPWHLARPKSGGAPGRVLVIGDSLASGGFGEFATWVDRLAEKGLEIHDLSSPSENTRTALLRREEIEAFDDGLVIVELGGNDMLGDSTAAEFDQALDELLTLAREKNRSVVMFELPILPGRWAFGRAQRLLTQKHGIALIPKRVLASVLADPRNTSDGIHLTQRGHDQLATRVIPWLDREPQAPSQR